MRYLFVFAHPDDETVACAGTIHQLRQRGDEVCLLYTTDGGAGEITSQQAADRLQALGSVQAVRQEELARVRDHLGVSELRTLDFADGMLTNQAVWGALKEEIVSTLSSWKPDVVITFEHGGWYFHLDHVGTSIATTLAFQQAAHAPHALLFSYYRPTGTQEKWKYVFPETLPITHSVTVADVEHKLAALEHHASQDLQRPKQFAQTHAGRSELYQLALATAKGERIFKNHPVFRTVDSAARPVA